MTALTCSYLPKAPDRVFLYEIYQDRTAFEVHLKTEHFLEFSEKTKGYIKDRTILGIHHRERQRQLTVRAAANVRPLNAHQEEWQ